MKSFWLNGYSGRQERWAEDGHRWVAAEPRKNGFALWGYQDDRTEIVYLGDETREEQLEKLADQFLLGDPETINAPFFHNDISDITSSQPILSRTLLSPDAG